jgi:uncharacterized protein
VDFFRAVDTDNARAVKDLLDRGFDPNAANAEGQVALYLALRDDAARVAEALLAHPQIRIDQTNAAGETPLMIAALKGRREWVRRLLDRGAQLNRDGWTPLHYAASGPDAKPVVELLLERGAAIDARAPNGNTPLMMAARYGAWTSAEFLLLRGANPKLVNQAGQNAADFARSEGRERLAQQIEQLLR